MRHLMTVLAGAVLMSVMTETAAIAQFNEPCARIRPQSVPFTTQMMNGSFIHFGRTRQGDWLELNPFSIAPVSGGVRFTYFLNGRAIDGFTNCNTAKWYANGRGHSPTSPAARTMLNYICGTRISGN